MVARFTFAGMEEINGCYADSHGMYCISQMVMHDRMDGETHGLILKLLQLKLKDCGIGIGKSGGGTVVGYGFKKNTVIIIITKDENPLQNLRPQI